MQTPYQAQRLSKRRADEVKKANPSHGAILLGTFSGFIIVEPSGAGLGDGEILSREEADYELQAAWHLGPKATLGEARSRLGLARLSASGA